MHEADGLTLRSTHKKSVWNGLTLRNTHKKSVWNLWCRQMDIVQELLHHITKFSEFD
jgi:hypothetical protein